MRRLIRFWRLFLLVAPALAFGQGMPSLSPGSPLGTGDITITDANGSCKISLVAGPLMTVGCPFQFGSAISATGAANIDFSGSSGTFKTSTGASTFGGSSNTFTNAITHPDNTYLDLSNGGGAGIRHNSAGGTISVNLPFIATSYTANIAANSVAVNLAVDGARLSFDGANDWCAGDGSGHLVCNAAQASFGTGQTDSVVITGGASGGTIDSSGGTLTIGGTNATQIPIGTSTTTKPVKIAGGSGAFVGSANLSSGTQTFTVPTGAKCVCSVTNAFLACQVSVSSTTATVTVTGGGSDNVVVICL